MHSAKVIAASALLSSAFALTSGVALAQDAEVAAPEATVVVDTSPPGKVGAGVVFNTEGDLGVGLQANAYYGIPSVLKGLRLGGAFTYYFPDFEPLTYWTLDLGAQYRFSKPGPFGLYLLGALEIAHASIETSAFGVTIEGSDTDVGVKVGMGIEYAVQPNIEIFGELAYTIISGYDAATIGAGARFLF